MIAGPLPECLRWGRESLWNVGGRKLDQNRSPEPSESHNLQPMALVTQDQPDRQNREHPASDQTCYHSGANMAWYLCCSVLLCLFAVSCNSPKTSTPNTVSAGASSSPKTPRPELTVDDVLGWRSNHGGDLLGKDKDAVIARYGEPDPTSTGSRLEYTATGKALDRSTNFLIESSKVSAIKVYSKEGDSLNVEEVIKKATLFTFKTGTFADSTSSYFAATTKDDRNIIQFLISDSDVSLSAVVYVYKP
jgi:hypothetical protein